MRRPRRKWGRVIVIAWAATTIIWQLALLSHHHLDDRQLVRTAFMFAKPAILATLILTGHAWARLVAGLTGPIFALFYLVLGLLLISYDSLGATITIAGAVIYFALSIAVLTSKSVDRLGG